MTHPRIEPARETADVPSCVLLVWGRATGLGGTETRMCEVIEQLSAMGIGCVSHMLAPPRDTPLVRALTTAGSEVHTGASPMALRKTLRTSRPSIVFTFGLTASLTARFVRALSGKRSADLTLVDARNGLEAGRSSSLWAVDRWTQRWVDVYVANSHAVASLLREKGIDESRLKVLFSGLPAEWHARTTRHRAPGSVVMVGNDRPEKRQELGVRIFAESRTGGHLTVYTNDTTRVDAAWTAVAHPDSGRFTSIAGMTVSPEVLETFAVMLHPSSHESAPRAIMEARARGCFVITCDVGDAHRLVGDEGGEVLHPSDVDGLKAALAQAVAKSLAGELHHNFLHAPDAGSYAPSLLSLVHQHGRRAAGARRRHC
ncbi:MAG: glycosyltransferase family 4 protein [Candidatus Nanopelagicales bacterium]